MILEVVKILDNYLFYDLWIPQNVHWHFELERTNDSKIYEDYKQNFISKLYINIKFIGLLFSWKRIVQSLNKLHYRVFA